MKPEYQEKEVKTILNAHRFINPWLWDRYSLSAYQGCEFGCIYCYARGGKYSRHLGEDGKIFVKRNAAAMLDARLTRTRTLLPDVVGMSGMCDPYQPCETSLLQTRKCLEVFAKHCWPVHVLTKSALVLRDLDILSQIAKDTWAAVTFTITTANASAAEFLEPRAASPQERLDAISAIKKRESRIHAGIAAIPIIPGIEDGDKDIQELVRRASGAGADYFLFSPGLTLEGGQADSFLAKMQAAYPQYIPLFEDLYRFSYVPGEYAGTYGPKASYISRLSKRIWALLDEHRLPYRMKRFIPEDYRKTNYRISEKLLNDAYRLQAIGKAWSKLYWAGQNIQNLKEPIEAVALRDGLGSIRNVSEDIEKNIREYVSLPSPV